MMVEAVVYEVIGLACVHSEEARAREALTRERSPDALQQPTHEHSMPAVETAH